MTRRRIVANTLLLTLGLLAVACTGGSSPQTSGSGTPSVLDPSTRPSSPAKIRILSPKNGAVIHGTSFELKLSLQNAKVVAPTTTDIRPDQGHIHVLVDNRIVTMTYGLHQTIDGLTPGQHLLRVEFVASDHAPFNPRVFAPAVTFEVKP